MAQTPAQATIAPYTPNEDGTVGPNAIARRLGVDARDVRKYVRNNAVSLIGEAWPDERTTHRYTPTLAADIERAMRAGSAGGAVLKSKSERGA